MINFNKVSDLHILNNAFNNLFSQNQLNWYLASKACKGYGMNLVTIKSPPELLNARSVMEQAGLENDILWTDGIDLGSENNFYWSSTGENFDYAPWHETQPDNGSNNENCAGIVKWFKNVRLNDDDCSKKFHFICSQSVKDIDVECAIL